MPNIGYSFNPSAGIDMRNGGGSGSPGSQPRTVGSGPQSAVEVLKLHLPRVLGANAIAPSALLNAPGASGAAPGASSAQLFQMLANIFLPQGQQPGGPSLPQPVGLSLPQPAAQQARTAMPMFAGLTIPSSFASPTAAPSGASVNSTPHILPNTEPTVPRGELPVGTIPPGPPQPAPSGPTRPGYDPSTPAPVEVAGPPPVAIDNGQSNTPAPGVRSLFDESGNPSDFRSWLLRDRSLF